MVIIFITCFYFIIGCLSCLLHLNSMLTHMYTHQPLRKIKMTICNHQADSPLYVWPDV